MFKELPLPFLIAVLAVWLIDARGLSGLVDRTGWRSLDRCGLLWALNHRLLGLLLYRCLLLWCFLLGRRGFFGGGSSTSALWLCITGEAQLC